MIGLGFVGEKDFSAFISEVILGDIGREWESETKKGKKPMRCTLPSRYHRGQLSLITTGTLEESVDCDPEFSCPRSQGVGVLINHKL